MIIHLIHLFKTFNENITLHFLILFKVTNTPYKLTLKKYNLKMVN